MLWLIDRRVLFEMLEFKKAGIEFDKTGISDFEEKVSAPDLRIYNQVGNTANISIDGILTKQRSFMAYLFGGGNTSYREIISAIEKANQDPLINNIVFEIDSPGGMVSGLFETLDAISSSEKQITSIVSDQAASAAYGIASVTDKIIAKNKATEVGSIGVAVDMTVWPEDVSITSDAAPKKRPDVTTTEGVEMVKEELNAIHELFAGSIAAGRNTSIEKVNADFGQGGVLLADEALKRGMIDEVQPMSLEIVSQHNNPTTAGRGRSKKGESCMDLQELKSQHPELYNEVVEIGVERGTELAYDLVNGHLTMGKECDAMDIAVQAIQDRKPMNNVLTAQYLTAAKNQTDITTRQTETDDLEIENVNDDENEVVSIVERKLGITGGAK